MNPVIAIIGRPNVGKSTLFNKLIKRRRALVKDEPGVTRDRIYGRVEFQNKSFVVIDTGGFLTDADGLTAKVQEQTRMAIQEADRVIFLLDGRSPLTIYDLALDQMLKKMQKKSYYVINKIDKPSMIESIDAEFYKLGANKLYFISAEHNFGLDELLMDITSDIPPSDGEREERDIPRIAIVGRPNVGKSSLVNKLLGMERVVVSEIPGTTRDTVDVLFQRNDQKYIFLDTSGIRKRAKVTSRLELLSTIKALRAIDDCDVSVLLTDAIEGIVSQDLRIGQFIIENGKGFVLAINKWDLIQSSKGKNTEDIQIKFLQAVENRFRFLSHIPVVFLSALTGYGTEKLLDTIELVINERSRKIKTSELNKFIRRIIKEKPPPDYKNKDIKINYCTQVSTSPPAFLFFTNYPEGITESYRRYIKNKIYDEFGFVGTEIRLFFRRK